MGYFLLTGQPVFDAEKLVELCQKHVDAIPIPPSERLGKPVSSELEHALLACLEKSRAKRPQTARDLALLLARCPAAGHWSIEESEEWWSKHERRQPHVPAEASETSRSQSVYDRTIITNR